MPFVRLALSVVAALFFFNAGSDLRELGNGLDPAYGLLAYGAAFATLSYGASGFQTTRPERPKAKQPQEDQPARSFYDDQP